jgi:ribosome-associated heat shock protein Hsp15
LTGQPRGLETLRIDKWLWHARFARSRGKAVSLIAEGCVRLNRKQVLKPSIAVTPGDLITLVLSGTVRAIEVRALGSRRGPAIEARDLYRDLKSDNSADAQSKAASSETPDLAM